MTKNSWQIKCAIAVMMMTAYASAEPGAQPDPQAKAPKAPRTPAPAMYWASDSQSAKGASYLGVDVADISKDRVSALKLKDEHGVEITMVDQDAPAGKAGLKEHDVILEFNGTRVEGEEQLRRMIHETPAGRTVTLGISRDGQTMNLQATLAAHSKTTMVWSSGTPMPSMPPMPPIPSIPEVDMPDVNVMVRSYSVTAGMMVDNLTPQLGEFFGVKSGQGVLVRSVEKGSAAEAAGLKAGDVIVKVGDEKIADRSDWRRALRDRKSAKVPLGIVREKREQTLTITLSEPRSKNSSKLDHRTMRRDGDVDLADSDDDFDMDFDADWDSAAIAAVQVPQQIAKVLQTVQADSAKALQQSLRALQPQMHLEMEKSQKRIQEEMKRMEEKLRELQTEE